ncbi:P-loop containing nucleoside triphosphate hydrolase protein [Xylaria arbuscula]|nr:P-loop containing nucleoside triphosphate hydrolase protein [Xylaria arbuscula]
MRRDLQPLNTIYVVTLPKWKGLDPKESLELGEIRPLPHYIERAQLPRLEPESYECISSNCSRVFEIRLIHEKPSLRIICPLLIGALRRASANSLGDYKKEDRPAHELTIREPYEWIFHNWNRISQAAREDEEEHTSIHAELLLKFVKAERPSTWEKLVELDSRICEEIAFDDLWLIYNIGTTVFAKDDGGWRAYKVERTESSSRSNNDSMSVHCLYLDWESNGRWLTPQHEIFTIQSYTSERSIADLQLVPEWYFQEPDNLKRQLVERGVSFWEQSSKVNYREYSGNAWPLSSQTDPVKIIIDYVTSSKRKGVAGEKSSTSCSASACPVCVGETLGILSFPPGAPHDLTVCTRQSYGPAEESEDLSDDLHAPLLFCPSRIWAFSLVHKSWELILPQEIKQVRAQEDALSEVKIPDDYKTYLESALVKYLKDEHQTNSGDTLTRMGRGFTILLHGSPGTGKTLTVECLAAKYVVPLYRITSGDLGIDVDMLKDRLQEASLRATNWKALLLLDEADLFIYSRKLNDARRNSLVSTFFHHLDDSEALLLMTANCVEKIDCEIESRLSMAIGLPEISFESQKHIWKTWIHRLGNLTPDQEEELLYFVEREKTHEEGQYAKMNGRQIKNCIAAASALARQENQTLDYKHIARMLDLGLEFRKLMGMTSDSPRHRYNFIKQGGPR